MAPLTNDEEYRRNQHSDAAGGISGVLDTARTEDVQPQEPQRSARRGGGTA